jgi:hypothetical protein
MAEDNDSRVSSGLRGWLSEVYFPSLLDGALAALAARLGGRATVDDPLFGRVAGLPDLESHLARAARWLGERRAQYAHGALVVGTDRDVAEGTLTLAIETRTVLLPVAVVSERRKSREVELRLYYATGTLRTDPVIQRGQLVPLDDELSLPRMVADHVAALRKGDIDALLACFESEGLVRDARGLEHRKAGGGLRVFYEQRYAVGRDGGGAYRIGGGSADDGRCCAVEFTLTHARGEPISPRPGLAVYEIGDSGLLRSLRLYEELDAPP